MFKRVKFCRRLALAGLFLGLLVADAMQLLPAPKTAAGVNEAVLFPWHIIAARKVYDPEGNFMGCTQGGNNCVIIYSNVTGEFNVSTEGIHSQSL